MKKSSLKILLKTGLFIFIILFVLTAMLSANTFITAKQSASQAYLLDRAVTEACTIAETLKASDGSLSETVRLLTNHKSSNITDNILTLYYDENLNPCIEKKASYKAVVTSEYLDKHNLYYIIINTLDDKMTLYSIDFKYLCRGGHE